MVPKVLTPDQINLELAELEFNWKIVGKHLEIELKAKDFSEAMWVLNEVGQAAEELNHHPDLSLHSYNQLKISTTTHSEGGLTAGDFALAEKIDAVITRIA